MTYSSKISPANCFFRPDSCWEVIYHLGCTFAATLRLEWCLGEGSGNYEIGCSKTTVELIRQQTRSITFLKLKPDHHLILRLHVLRLQINGETPTWNGVSGWYKGIIWKWRWTAIKHVQLGLIRQQIRSITFLKLKPEHHLILRLHILRLQINGETPTWNGVKWVI